MSRALDRIHRGHRLVLAGLLLAILIVAGGFYVLLRNTGRAPQPILLLRLDGCDRDFKDGDSPTCILRHQSATNNKSQYIDVSVVGTIASARITLLAKPSRRFGGHFVLGSGRADQQGLAKLTLPVAGQGESQTIYVEAHASDSDELIGQASLLLRWVDAPDISLEGRMDKDHTGVLPTLHTMTQEILRIPDADQRSWALLWLGESLLSLYELERNGQKPPTPGLLEALRKFHELALDEAERAGLLLTQYFLLDELDREAQGNIELGDRVEQRIAALIPKLARLPRRSAQLSFLLASNADMRGQVQRALDLAKDAEREAEFVRDDKLLEGIRLLIEKQLVSLTEEQACAELAAEAARDAIVPAGNPESYARGRMRLAWRLLLCREKNPAAPASVGATASHADPLRILQDLLAKSTGPAAIVHDAERERRIHASLARRYSLPGRLAGGQLSEPDWQKLTRQHIDAARACRPNIAMDPEVEFDLQLSEIRLMLANGNLRDAGLAIAKIRAFLSAPAQGLDPQWQLEDRNRWEFECGLGAMRVAAAEKVLDEPQVAALRHEWLVRCNEQLDRTAQGLRPLLQPTAAAPNTQGFGRLLSHAVSHPGKASDAVLDYFLREAQRRTTALYRTVEIHSPEAAHQLATLRGAYQKQRQATSELHGHTYWPAQNPQTPESSESVQNRYAHRQASVDALGAYFQKQLAATTSGLLSPRLRDYWLVLSCLHVSAGLPAGSGSLLCTSRLGTELHSHSLSGIDAKNSRMLAEVLLRPWRTRLPRRGQTQSPIVGILVLGHAWTQDAPVEAWPLDGEPLVTRMLVAHSMDIVPPVRETAVTGAVAAVHPYNNLGGAGPTLQILEAQLRPHVDQLKYFSRDQPPPSLPVDTDSTYGNLTAALRTARLFVAVGHIAPAFCDKTMESRFQGNPLTSGLCLPGNDALTVPDILLSEHVPDYVLLLGCRSAAHALPSPLPSLTLANAYILRGAKGVIGTSQTIPVELTRQILCHMLRTSRLDSPELDLPTALAQAQRAIARGEACPGGLPAAQVQGMQWWAVHAIVPM